MRKQINTINQLVLVHRRMDRETRQIAKPWAHSNYCYAPPSGFYTNPINTTVYMSGPCNILNIKAAEFMTSALGRKLGRSLRTQLIALDHHF